MQSIPSILHCVQIVLFPEILNFLEPEMSEEHEVILVNIPKGENRCELCRNLYRYEDDDGKCMAYDVELHSNALCPTCRNVKAALLEMKFEEMARELGFGVHVGKRAVASLLGLKWVYGDKLQLPDIYEKIEELASKRTRTSKPYCLGCKCLGSSLSCITCMKSGYECKGICFCCYGKRKQQEEHQKLETDAAVAGFEVIPLKSDGQKTDPINEKFGSEISTFENQSYCECCGFRVKSKPCPSCMAPNSQCCVTCLHCNDDGKEMAEDPEEIMEKEIRTKGYAIRNLLGKDDTEVPSYRSFCSCCNFELKKTPCYLCVEGKSKCVPECETCNPDKMKKDGDQPPKPRMNRKNEIVIVGDCF